jgi:hypothetical protein
VSGKAAGSARTRRRSWPPSAVRLDPVTDQNATSDGFGDIADAVAYTGKQLHPTREASLSVG